MTTPTTTAITLSATRRPNHGKSPAGRVRRDARLPAIMYGPGEPTTAISVDPKSVKAILSAPLGRNTVVTLDVEGHSTLAMLKSFDHHPLTRSIVHADFYVVALDRPIVVPVPFVLTGRAKGVASEGGILRQIFRTLPVRCTPDKIPAKIELDVSPLGLGEGLHVRDLKLPAGVSVKLDAGQTVVSVVSPERDSAADAAAATAATAAAGAPAIAAATAPAAGKTAAPAKDAAKTPAKAAAPTKKK